MYIYCAKSDNNQKNLSQVINRVGKYLYKNLDGAYKISKSSNTVDVWTTILYSIPYELRSKYDNNQISDDVQSMDVDINLTTYSNKIRVNVIVEDPYERTISFSTIDSKYLEPGSDILEQILSRVKRILEKEFSDYDFLI